MYKGQETHPIRLNARYEMNWANSVFEKVLETPFSAKYLASRGPKKRLGTQQGKSEGFESCDRLIDRKRPIWVKIGVVLYRVTLKFDGWPWKTIGYLSFVVSSFVQHFIAIGEFKLELHSGTEMPNLGQIRQFLEPCDLEIWCMTLKNNRTSLLCYCKLYASFRSHRWIQAGVTVRKHPIWFKFDYF